MYTTSEDKQEDELKVIHTSEEYDAYEHTRRFMYDFGGDDVKATVSDIEDFIYRIYPTFFLKGIKYMGKFYIITRNDMVENAETTAGHYPSRFTRIRLSMFVRQMSRNNGWDLKDSEIANIVLMCASDFSDDYMDFFPYTVRIFTGNENKRRAYRTAFDGKPVQFCVYEFIEPQEDELKVVAAKMTDIEETQPDPDEIAVVDDTGIALYALQGNPGPMIKPFLQRMTCNQLADLLEKVGETRGHLDVTIGVTYNREETYQRIVVSASFPIRWQHQMSERDSGFDESVVYKDHSLAQGHESPHQVLLEWMWHRFRRRMDNRL